MWHASSTTPLTRGSVTSPHASYQQFFLLLILVLKMAAKFTLMGLDSNGCRCQFQFLYLFVILAFFFPIYKGRTAGFLPSVSAAVNKEGKLVVMIRCLAMAVPNATVTWTRSGQNVSFLSGFVISNDTTWLHIVNFNISVVGLHTYTCTAVNPLGSQSQDTTLSGVYVQMW